MKKNHLFITAAIAVLLLTTLACQVSFGGIGARTVRGSGDVVVVERPVSDFDNIELSGVGQMFIEVGNVESLRIEAEDNLMEYIETEVRGDTLNIDLKRGTNLRPTEPIRYYVTVVNLDGISVSGAGSIHIPDLKSSSFSVHISGAGNVDIEGLTANELDVEISGVGDLSIDGGKVDQQKVEISGTGNHNTREMESAEADIRLSGLGGATVWVTDQLSVDISGAGSVKYIGDASVDSHVSGLGSVKKIGE